jgi:UDP:flavonoid glycosyltransferase YjiC (YdhE family)
VSTRRLLFVSGSLGLGHATRDLAIARQLRHLQPDLDIDWLAADPASALLAGAGERLLPEAADLANENVSAERAARHGGLNLTRYLLASRAEWRCNVAVFRRVVSQRRYDLVIGDETYEINLALREDPALKQWPFVMIFDFVGLDAMTRSPLEHLAVYVWNRKWCADYLRRRTPPYDLGLFVGEADDVPDAAFGPGLPGRRAFASAMYTFVGYVLPFEAATLPDTRTLRSELGYGDGPLVIAAVGGTAIGGDLLRLCAAAFPAARASIPGLRMVLVAGPRLASADLQVPEGVEIRAFVPDLYRHFAACDLAIVQGGATSAIELMALRRPFIYFPLAGHSEQAGVARNLRRRGAGVEMVLGSVTPRDLGGTIAGTIGHAVTHDPIPVNGAREAAGRIAGLLREPG